MKLFNTIAVFDTYIVAEDAQSARDTLLSIIYGNKHHSPEIHVPPNEITATEARMERSIRPSCQTERPFIGDDVSDADFKKCQGKTTIEIFEHIYTKRG